jgi:hypothetical protein
MRDELLSSERLEERAKALSARLTVDPAPRRGARDLFPRFASNARALREAYLTIADDVHAGAFVTPAAEWLLDNYHLVASEIRDVRQNLPRGFYRALPKLAARELPGGARICREPCRSAMPIAPWTHAAMWAVMATARLGYGDEAVELFHMLNPANHTRTALDVSRYKAEPFVLAGDVFAHPSHAGRAGWSWYTGSAGWMYRAGLESILGLRRRGSCSSSIPASHKPGRASRSSCASVRPPMP